MNTDEQLYNDLIVLLSNKFNEEEFTDIKTSISTILSKYDVSIRETQLTVYEYIPKALFDYLAIRKIEGLSIKTLQTYSNTLKKFFVVMHMPIEQMRTNDIRLYIESSNGSARYKALVKTIICTFFKWATAEGYINSNPCAIIKPIKYVREKRESLTEVELDRIKAACETIRERAIIELLESTACRVSELCNMKLKDVEFGNPGKITVLGKGNKKRPVYFGKRAEDALKTYLATRTDDNEYLFVYNREPYMPLKKSGVEKIIHEIGVRAKLDRNLFPHLFRHTTATMAVKHGMPVQDAQRMLGHENINTTMTYVDTFDEVVKFNHQKYIY